MGRSRAAPDGMNIDKTKPMDFDLPLDTNDELPSPETLRRIDNHEVLDEMGDKHKFSSLVSGCKAAWRILVIFVRHFGCGACEEYLRSLSDSIRTEPLPTGIRVIVIGCGDPDNIAPYKKRTNWSSPIYTDPSRLLFNDLGMVKTLVLGSKPEYYKKNLLQLLTDNSVQALMSPKLAFKSGPLRQAGGEFLFDIVIPSPAPRNASDQIQTHDTHKDDSGLVDEKRVTWCHRMRTMRDHTEISPIRELLRAMPRVARPAAVTRNEIDNSFPQPHSPEAASSRQPT